jgi:hypothetical protein
MNGEMMNKEEFAAVMAAWPMSRVLSECEWMDSIYSNSRSDIAPSGFEKWIQIVMLYREMKRFASSRLHQKIIHRQLARRLAEFWR